MTLQETINRYFPYLLEIRKRLLFVVSLFAVAAVIGFIYYEKITFTVLQFFSLKGVNVVFTSPFQFFSLAINSGIVAGLVVVFPLLLYQLLAFLKPALRPKEFKLVVAALPLSLVLAGLGFTFGIWVMKYIVAIFYQKSLELHIGNVLDIELLLSKIILTSALMGLAFQFPVVMTFLMHFKLIKHRQLVAWRPFAYMVALLFVMLLPPTDLVSDVLLVLPLVLLFELTLILNRVFLKTHLF